MSDKEVILTTIKDALTAMLQSTIDADRDQLESTDWWTNQVMTALFDWGIRNLKKGFVICLSTKYHSTDMQDRARVRGGRVQGEWLFDFTCLEYDDKGYLTGVPLVAECEWNDSKDYIDDDFQKLLLARADVRLMIFNGNRYRCEEDRSSNREIPIKMNELLCHIKTCEHTRAGDTYLLAARLHESDGHGSENHRFHYEPLVVPSNGIL